MKDILDSCLFKQQKNRFLEIEESANSVLANYSGTLIIRNTIFALISNYARKKELGIEVLRYPVDDKELWAVTFVKKGTVFLVINSKLELCKQLFAAAHEFYHIICYVEDKDLDTITEGSLLDSKTVDENAASQEDLEANAFAGLLLMPVSHIDSQIKMYGIEPKRMTVDDVILLMDLFAIPYKAVVMRLFENGTISESKAKELIAVKSDEVADRIERTGKAIQWQQNSDEVEIYGSLLDNMAFNIENELLTDRREQEDKEYIEKIENLFHKK